MSWQYTAPEHHLLPLMSFPMCESTARDDCSVTERWFTEDIQKKCQAFTSNVNSANNPWLRSKIYKNKYCLQCIEGHNKIYHHNFDNNARFDVTRLLRPPAMSTMVQVTKRYLKLSARSIYTFPNIDLAWKSATCLLNGKLSCQVHTCQQSYEMRPDGTCKQLKQLHLAVDMGQKQTLDVVKHTNLAQVLQCLLVSHLSLDVDDDLPPSLTKYNIEGHSMYGAVVFYYANFDDGILKETIITFYREVGNDAVHLLNLNILHLHDRPMAKRRSPGFQQHYAIVFDGIEKNVTSYHQFREFYQDPCEVRASLCTSWNVNVSERVAYGSFNCFTPTYQHPRLINSLTTNRCFVTYFRLQQESAASCSKPTGDFYYLGIVLVELYAFVALMHFD